MTRSEVISYITGLGYGADNAEAWVSSADFNGSWRHPAGVLTVTWNGGDNYEVRAS